MANDSRPKANMSPARFGNVSPRDEGSYDFTYMSPMEIREAREVEMADEGAEYEGLAGRRVNFVYDMIESNRWVPAKTGKELALVWGCTYDTIKQYSAEAYRRFKSAIKDPEEIRSALISRLDGVMAMAMNNKKVIVTKEEGVMYVDEPNFTAAVAAAKEIKSLVGIDKKTIEHRHTNHEDQELDDLLAGWREHKKLEAEKAKELTDGRQRHAERPDNANKPRVKAEDLFRDAEGEEIPE